MLYREQTFAPRAFHSELQQQTNTVNAQKSTLWACDRGCAEACAERFSALNHFPEPCQGLTKTSKVWVQINIFSHKEVTWSRDQKYLQFGERLDGHFELWGWNFSLWLVITTVHFVFREEIQVNQNTKTSRDFLAWKSWKLTSWACYRGCCAKGKKSWRCCLGGKYVRYTKMTPVIYFAPQTLNNKEFYDANLIFQERGLS